MYLIHQTSIKDRANADSDDTNVPETTGKFGTGFMTTHLLSRVVAVSGIFNNVDTKTFQKFSFILDRSATTKPEMVEKYDNIFKIFDRLDNFSECPLLENYTSGVNCDTSFKYKLDDQGREAAGDGMKDFEMCVALMLAFNPQVN